MKIHSTIYNSIFIPIGLTLISIMKRSNKKLADREDNYHLSWESIKQLGKKKGRRIWFHASSMGEFEQAKPVIELIKDEHRDIEIICSFYSPSGYNNQKNYSYADATAYMPFDTKSRAKDFIDMIDPDQAIFVRYDIWRNHLEYLNEKQIPCSLINATFPNSILLTTMPCLKSYTKSNYGFFDHIFTMNHTDTQLFQAFGLDNNSLSTSSDTRFDRIIQKVENVQEIIPPQLFEDEFVLIVGSSWPEEEDIIINSLPDLKNRENLRIIFVPHEPTDAHIDSLESKLVYSIRLSEVIQLLTELSLPKLREHISSRAIIVDSIGKLLALYALADAACVGGAFGAGVHSVTEPAGYGMPLSTGTKMQNSPDAVNLKKLGALTCIKDSKEFSNWLRNIMEDKNLYKNQSEIAKHYVYEGRGTSQKIVDYLLEKI